MKTAQISAVVVGADRVAANGDTANKIGTYQVSIQRHINYNILGIDQIVCMPYTDYFNLFFCLLKMILI